MMIKDNDTTSSDEKGALIYKENNIDSFMKSESNTSSSDMKESNYTSSDGYNKCRTDCLKNGKHH